MYRKGLIKTKKGKTALALLLALGLAFSNVSGYSDASSVYAAQTGTTESGSTGGEAGEQPAEEETDILKPKTGTVSFWEWKRVDIIKDALGDNQYHPILLASVKNYYSGYHPFFSSYSDREHVFLPTITTRANNFTSEFGSVKGNPEKETGDSGFYGKRDGEEHSPSYYFNAEENVYYVNTYTGKKGITDAEFNSNRFFTYGDSMGVPWIRAAHWGSDNGRTMVSICFPKKQLTNTEALMYQPDKNDFYLDVRGYESEPTNCITHGQVRDEYPMDIYHLVYNNKMWRVVSYNDDYRNGCAYDEFGSNILNGETDYGYLTMFLEKDYSIIPQGSKSSCLGRADCHYIFHMFVGTPHFMTSLESQKVEDGRLLPLEPGVFRDNDGLAAKSDGIILPKGETLTIDGGTVSVTTNFINNGTIEVKNGGTLIVKKGGCISPYTKKCDGEGTIKCDGGSVIIMEGGSIYGFCNGDNPNNWSSSYNTSNAPLLLTGGGTLVNYGKLVLTYAVVGNGCKIENRKMGSFNLGYNRTDPLEMLAVRPSTVAKVDLTKYPNLSPVGLYGIGSDKATVINEKTAYFEHSINRQVQKATQDPKNPTQTVTETVDLAPEDRVDIIVPAY